MKESWADGFFVHCSLSALEKVLYDNGPLGHCPRSPTERFTSALYYVCLPFDGDHKDQGAEESEAKSQ